MNNLTDYTKLIKIFTSSAYKSRYAHAKANNTCICCGEKAVEFNSAYTKLEYNVSALCENCQGRFFHTTHKTPIISTDKSFSIPL